MTKPSHQIRFTSDDDQKFKALLDFYEITVDGFTAQLREFIEKNHAHLILSENAPIQSEPERSTDLAVINENENLESNYFNCALLCSKSSKCNRDVIRDKSEIQAVLCYVSRFPYYWTPKGSDKNPCRCSYATFKSSQPYGDPDDPYPECMAKQKDVPFQLPKDRIIRDPKLCWLCYNTHQKMQDDAFKKKYIRQSAQSFQRAKVDWGNSVGEGEPDYHEGYR